MTISIRAWIEIIACLVIVAGVVAWTMHERSVGRAQIAAADAIATQKAQAAAKLQTDQLAAQAQKAATEASHAQATLTAYMQQFPIDSVVCYSDHRGPVVPEAAAAASGTRAVSPGPDPISPVPTATAGPNVGPGLAILVQAAARLAILEHEFQQRAQVTH